MQKRYVHQTSSMSKPALNKLDKRAMLHTLLHSLHCL
jgi:hypothetical protein